MKFKEIPSISQDLSDVSIQENPGFDMGHKNT